jgi:hypothetical protein
MEFRLALDPPQINPKIKITDRIMLMGSCFTEHMTAKLNQVKFNTLQNPNGILFNPTSIAKALTYYIKSTNIEVSSLFEMNSLWNHWDFHSSLSQPASLHAVEKINQHIHAGHHFLKEANWLIITFGSAFVYQLKNGEIIANCHKAPAELFTKKMLSIDDVVNSYTSLIKQIRTFNPALNIMFTVSPVRHLKEGFVENNRSKSVLLLSVEKIVSSISNCFYFPSYELIIDDLRDYRFYAEDMVHPNYLATNYVWEKFSSACIDGKSREIFKDIEQINNALRHRPLHPDSTEHKLFREKTYSVIMSLSDRFPNINWDVELQFFKDCDQL